MHIGYVYHYHRHSSSIFYVFNDGYFVIITVICCHQLFSGADLAFVPQSNGYTCRLEPTCSYSKLSNLGQEVSTGKSCKGTCFFENLDTALKEVKSKDCARKSFGKDYANVFLVWLYLLDLCGLPFLLMCLSS